MREIKFRGKRIDNAEWIFGSLCHVNDIDGNLAIIPFGDNRFIPVHRGTVGQYTGLKDKNGTEIYEGDLYVTSGVKQNYKVMFVFGSFVGGESEESCMPLGWEDNERDDTSWFEVVGNIYKVTADQWTKEYQGRTGDE